MNDKFVVLLDDNAAVKMNRHEKVVKELTHRKNIAVEVERIEQGEAGLLDASLKNKPDAALPQADFSASQVTAAAKLDL